MTLKETIYHYYQQQVQDKMDAFRDMISALTEDSKNDAKGSAGDKHETALSMMHLEQEKLNYKLAEILDQKAVLDKIDPEAASEIIVLGTLVQANGLLLFISTALPKITIEGKAVFAVSPKSPLASQMIGKAVGFAFAVNGTNYTIENVW